MKCKYPVWANLNKAGKMLFGDVFPEGQIPINIETGISFESELEGVKTQKIHLVNVKLLRRIDEEAYQRLLDKLSKKFEASKEEMNREFMLNDLPLRAILVSSIGFDPRFII